MAEACAGWPAPGARPGRPAVPEPRAAARWGMAAVRRIACRLAVGALAGSLIAAPAAAQDCAPMTRHFVFCGAGTDWAGARWDPAGDGATVVLDALRLDFAEDWLARDDALDPAAALEALLEAMLEGDTHEEMIRDGFAAGALSVARVIQTVAAGGDAPVLRAAMIAEADGARIFLRLDAPVGLPLDEIDRRSREVAGLVRPAQEG